MSKRKTRTLNESFETSTHVLSLPVYHSEMYILDVAGPLHREFGGPPAAVSGIASALASLGNHVKVIVCGQSLVDSKKNSMFFERLTRAGVEVELILRNRESIYGAFLRFRELKSAWKDITKSDFVILHQVFELQHISIAPMLALRKKHYVVMPHGSLTTYQRKQHRFRKLLFFPFTYLLLKNSKGIFVATEQEKIQLPRYLKELGNTVGLGVNLLIKQPKKSKQFPLTFNLLYMGRITKKKRLDIALKAFALVAMESDLHMKFTICGSGEKQDIAQMRNLVKELRIESDVVFRGWVDLSEKESVLDSSDCFILTSEDENFAIAAAEALASGIPCILSSNVALSELVSKHSAGVIFKKMEINEVADAIRRVTKSDKKILIDSSLRAASELSWDVVARRWESRIKSLL